MLDAAIPGDRNVIKKEAENILKYKDLITQIQRTWNLKANAILVIMGQLEPFQNHSDNT